MTEKLYEALEVCIKALETGADIEAVMGLYPQMAGELRPILEASTKARSLAAPSIPEDAMRRGRTRVLQHAAEMRESAHIPRQVRFPFVRLAASLALALIFLLGGTGIVNASSGALPGDNLYPVKRTWEEVRLWFTFSPEGREELESEYEQERLNEIDGLLAEGREETIAFYGIVTAQDGEYWLVSGVPVQITAKSQLPAERVSVGMPVTVVGRTNAQGFIEAQMVGILDPGVSLPPLEPTELEVHEDEGSQQDQQEEGGLTAPQQEEDDSTDDQGVPPRSFEFRGVVSSQKNDIWIINGQQVVISQAEIIGNISVGAFVKLEGYYAPDGKFIVKKIELRSNNNNKSDSSGNNKESNENDEDSDNDNSGKNDNDNDGEPDESAGD